MPPPTDKVCMKLGMEKQRSTSKESQRGIGEIVLVFNILRYGRFM